MEEDKAKPNETPVPDSSAITTPQEVFSDMHHEPRP